MSQPANSVTEIPEGRLDRLIDVHVPCPFNLYGVLPELTPRRANRFLTTHAGSLELLGPFQQMEGKLLVQVRLQGFRPQDVHNPA